MLGQEPRQWKDTAGWAIRDQGGADDGFHGILVDLTDARWGWSKYWDGEWICWNSSGNRLALAALPVTLSMPLRGVIMRERFWVFFPVGWSEGEVAQEAELVEAWLQALPRTPLRRDGASR